MAVFMGRHNTVGPTARERCSFSLATNGLLTMEASFDGTNGAQPGAALVQGSDGNYYGTTQSGGTYPKRHCLQN